MIRKKFTANISVSQKQLASAIRKALQEKLTQGFSKAKSKIEPRCQELVIDGLKKESAYSSILTGKLKTDFGLTDDIAAGFLSNLEELLKSKIKTYYRTSTSKNTLAVIYLDILKMDLDEVFAIPEASYISESKRGSFEIEWADWLLLAGSRVVVSGFETSREGTSVVSRSGKGVIMIPNQGGFRVDPAFAGNEQSNLLTRAALSNIDKIEQMFIEEVLSISN